MQARSPCGTLYENGGYMESSGFSRLNLNEPGELLWTFQTTLAHSGCAVVSSLPSLITLRAKRKNGSLLAYSLQKNSLPLTLLDQYSSVMPHATPEDSYIIILFICKYIWIPFAIVCYWIHVSKIIMVPIMVTRWKRDSRDDKKWEATNSAFFASFWKCSK